MIRRVAVGAGLIAFALAIAEIAAPGVLPVAPGGWAIYAIAAGALLYAYLVFARRSDYPYEQFDPPIPEASPRVPVPGDDVRNVVDRFLEGRHTYSVTRTREGLRTAAIDVVSNREGITTEEAERRVDAGEWTDDPYAAAFLGDRPLSIRHRLGALASPGSVYGTQVLRTADAIAAAAGIERSTSDDGDAGWRSLGRRVLGSRGRPSTTRRGARSRSGSAVSVDGGTAERGRSGDQSATADPDLDDRRATNHWYGVSVVALVAIAVGLFVEQPGVLLAGAVGVGYAAYARSGSPPAVDLSVERTISEHEPEPGEEVEVTVEVTNEGDQFLPDLRLVDGVPERLDVEDGSPRRGAVLRPGASVSFTYALTARRGCHEFGPLVAIARPLSGAVERSVAVETDGEIECLPRLRSLSVPLPLRSRTTRQTGPVGTDVAGEGIEFYGVREYRRGDAMSRIDWRRRARTGELATLEFREERAATVVIVVDVTEAAYVAPEPDAEHAVDRSVDAAARLFARLLDDGHRVGIATIGPAGVWIPPGAGGDHRPRCRRALALDVPAAPSTRHGRRRNVHRWTRRLCRRFPSDAQLVVLSPLCSGPMVDTLRTFEARGYPTTVVSPDPTATGTPGQRLARVRRGLDLTDLRGAGIEVIDWAADESIDAAVARAEAR